MRRLGWYTLRAIVAAFVLSSLLLLAANLYVQSHAVQQRIRSALATALQMPVDLRKTTVSPWDGVRFDGIVLDGAPGDERSGLLAVSSARVKFAWWPLITQHRFIVEQILLDRPHFDIRPGPTQPLEPEPAIARPTPLAILTPSATPATKPPETNLTTPPVVTTPADTPTATPRVHLGPAALFAEGLPFLVTRLRIRHGEVEFLDRSRQAQARVEDINADCTTPDAQHASGAVWFAKAGGKLSEAALTHYWTAVDVDPEKGIIARDGRGDVAGGTLTTDFRLRPEEETYTYAASAKLENVAIATLTRRPHDQFPMAQGKLQATFDLRGQTDDPGSRDGGGKVWIEGGQLHDFPLMKVIGQVLKIADLNHLEFKRAELTYRIEGSVLRVEPLLLVANDMQVTIKGNFLIDDNQLDLRGRLTIDHAIGHQLPQFIESNFTPCGDEAPGFRYLDFVVNGPADDPKSDLYEKLVSGPMKGLLDNLLAPKPQNAKAPRRDNSKKARPTPAATAH